MQTQTGLPFLILAGFLGGFGCEGSVSDEVNHASLEEATSALTSKTSWHHDFRKLYAAPPTEGSISQVRDLWQSRNYQDALRILALVTTPHAAWFATGTADEVRKSVRNTMVLAERQQSLPVLVAYNLPFRDCAQYSSGGAADTHAYKKWIDGFARGIGRGKAIVILEPDGLGIIPYNTTIHGQEEWCKPTVLDASGKTIPAPFASADERYIQLNYAVDRLALYAPNAAVYLDASNSGWLGIGEAAYRLTKAGVKRAHGFFLNVSNYQKTNELIQYGTWISSAIAASSAAPTWAFDEKGNFHFDWLPSQYDPAQNYAVNYSPDYVATVTAAIAPFLGQATATTPFVIDTGRNGQGPMDTSPFLLPPYNQPESTIRGLRTGYWCNGYGAGAGLRPTLTTGIPLLDAYLWIKVPGESDGTCDIAGGARAWDFNVYNPWGIANEAQVHFDPLWGQVDPEAGKWFKAQALQLAQKASPSWF